MSQSSEKGSREGKRAFEEDAYRNSEINPEAVPARDDKNENGHQAKENGVRSRDGSEPRRQSIGAAGERSPRYSSKGGSAGRMSGSPARRDSAINGEEVEDRRGRRRGSRSGSPRARRSRDRSGDKRDDGPFTQVFVTGYPRTTRRDDLHDLFSFKGEFGIVDVVMKSRFAFVEFKRPEDAAEAVRQLHRTDFQDRLLTVEQSCK